ncbi:MAG TPA: YdcF family protein [Dongiaceae bacterium]|nr:YdcF family protein [Dongiaceae bacterium]
MSGKAHRSSEHGGIVGSLIALLCLALLCAIIYLARHPIMRFAAETWIVDEPAPHADAILVLGDDNFYADRATRAAELSREQIAPVVVASGRRLRPSAGIAELIEHDLIERGVPKEKIVRFSHDADGTREEAEFLAKLAAERHWKSVVIVTSNYHARRARYIFEHVFPGTVSVASARDADFDPQRWWEKRKSTKLFVRELAGMVVAMWELHGEEKKEPPSSGNNPEKSRVEPLYGPNGHKTAKMYACPLHPLSALLS